MSETITGKCNCGAIEFTVDKAVFPAHSGICHCLDCRKSCGSLFSVNLPIAQKDIKFVKGTPKVFSRNADSGNQINRNFCGDCGSPVYSVIAAAPDVVFVKAGLFNIGEVPPAAGAYWTKNKESWEHTIPGLPQTATQ